MSIYYQYWYEYMYQGVLSVNYSNVIYKTFGKMYESAKEEIKRLSEQKNIEIIGYEKNIDYFENHCIKWRQVQIYDE